MCVLIAIILNATLILILRGNLTSALVWNDDDLQAFLAEAGCEICWNATSKESKAVEESCKAAGTLLERGACMPYGYQRRIVPETPITKVYATINHQRVRAVDDKATNLSIDFTLTMKWMDSRIKTNFSQEDKENGCIGIDINNADEIWQPNLYIGALNDYKAFSDSKQLTSLSVLTNNPFNEDKTLVELAVEAKSRVYCNFSLDSYPMDTQVCEFKLGSRSSGVDFVLHDPNNKHHNTDIYRVGNLELTIDFFDGDNSANGELIGLKIQMARIIQAFVYEYYLPCIAIVLVSGISFIIPLTAIPGRVALLVTQFLTLTNLFIHQTVIITFK